MPAYREAAVIHDEWIARLVEVGIPIEGGGAGVDVSVIDLPTGRGMGELPGNLDEHRGFLVGRKDFCV